MATTNRPRSRQKGPSNAEWDRIKPVFERLYIGENLKLPRISAILDRDHDFHAAPYMYKLRISQWGLRKNFKREELEVVASTAGHFVEAGLNFPTAIIGNREVPIERAKRHFRQLFLVDTRNQSRSVTEVTPSLRQRPPVCTKRHRNRGFILQRRSAAIPRIFLQQSAESHLLESTLAAVNNYYGWRLTLDEDYFINQTDDAGDDIEAVMTLDPANVMNSLINCCIALYDGAYNTARASIQHFCRQARILLFQQHPYLLISLINVCVRKYSGIIGQLHRSAVSHLNAIARRVLPPTHPIVMILQLLQCREETTASSRLLLKVMCEIAERQHGVNAETIFETEFFTAQTSFDIDEFDVALEACESFWKRCVKRFGEGHRFCRQALYLVGSLNFVYHLYDEAEEIMLRVLKLDDFDELVPENADWTCIRVMEQLGRICEGKREISEAEKWFFRAHAGSCQVHGSDHFKTQSLLDRLNQVRRSLNQKEEMTETSEEDGAGIIEELQMQFAQVALEETTEVGSQPARAEPWNLWEKDIQRPSNRNSVAQRRRRRRSFASSSVSTAEDDDEDLRDDGSESYAASERDISRNSGAAKPPVEGGCEKSSSTQNPAQDLVHVEDAGDTMWQESQFPKFEVYDGAAVAPMAVVEDPLTILFQQNIADFQEHMESMDANQFNFSQFDIDSMEPFDRVFDDFLMEPDVPNNFEIVDNHPQGQATLPNNISSPAAEPFFSTSKQDTRSPQGIKLFGFDNLDSTEMFEGTIDLPTMDVNMSEGVDTIDPKVIFCNSGGHGYAF